MPTSQNSFSDAAFRELVSLLNRAVGAPATAPPPPPPPAPAADPVGYVPPEIWRTLTEHQRNGIIRTRPRPAHHVAPYGNRPNRRGTRNRAHAAAANHAVAEPAPAAPAAPPAPVAAPLDAAIANIVNDMFFNANDTVAAAGNEDVVLPDIDDEIASAYFEDV
ncbi:hypothetical protein SISNIDRAFT_491759 [Sistotremastrum niveocremeum HHB9708]|uniref:Uncharacterized protein n=1 Tax=Sistotremastrum niveocremeum HHB9708 TaxID=1314777 RepID=A0A164MFA1_9AGAM|nr:hypothetical protein SISNIDRAFT_491759 [Sistotremastrum niveocremeum HHB9708]